MTQQQRSELLATLDTMDTIKTGIIAIKMLAQAIADGVFPDEYSMASLEFATGSMEEQADKVTNAIKSVMEAD